MKTKRSRIVAGTLLLVVALGVAAGVVLAQLNLSNFEIGDGNFVVNNLEKLDWAGVDDTKQPDEPSGALDDSFKGGTKEDDAVPVVAAGSIPPNKSDLDTFGIYVEDVEANGTTHKFLHMFWTRVQDPSGTTNMDFEFNKNYCERDSPGKEGCSDNGVTPIRSPGDLLIVYELANGGTVPNMAVLSWLDGSPDYTGECESANSFPCWGDRVNLSDSNDADGSINNEAIPAGECDGLCPDDPLSARTFGEATVSMDAIFNPGQCESFGSAYLKSRSSDSFTSSMKDFIAPLKAVISNCGEVTIRKQTDPDGATDSFAFSHTVLTDPPNGTSFNLSDDGVWNPSNVVFGTGYTVTEADPDSLGFDLEDITCECSSGANCSPDLATRTVTFDVGPGGAVDCTFWNRDRGTIIVQKITEGGTGTFGFTSTSLTPSSFSLTTTGEGEAGKDSLNFDDLVPGTYDVTETVPQSGWDLTSATCDDDSEPGEIDLGAGETVICTFENTKRGLLTLVKTVTNGNGGDELASAWTLSATAADPSQGLNFSGQGLQDPNINKATLGPNDVYPNVEYTLSEENGPDGYTAGQWSCVIGDDDPVESSTIILTEGQTAVCTINNDDDAPALYLVKHVINDNGLEADASAWTLSAGDNDVPGSESGALATDQVGTYALSESSVAGYTNTSITCDDDPGEEVTSVTIGLGETKTCTFVNDDDIATPTGTTVQSWVLHDTLTITGIRPGAPTGDPYPPAATVDFFVYDNAQCSGPSVGSETGLSIPESGVVSTVDGIVVTTPGLYFWVAYYSGDQFNAPFTTDCGSEVTQIFALDEEHDNFTDPKYEPY